MNSRPACDKRDAQGKKLALTPRSGLFRFSLSIGPSSEIPLLVRKLGTPDGMAPMCWTGTAFSSESETRIDPFSWVQGMRDFIYSFTAKKKNVAGFGHGIRECLGDVGTHVSEMPRAISRTMKMLWSLSGLSSLVTGHKIDGQIGSMTEI
jgi:hypothetical protein